MNADINNTQRCYPAAMDDWCGECGGHIRAGEMVRFNAYLQYLHPDPATCFAFKQKVWREDARFLKAIGVAALD